MNLTLTSLLRFCLCLCLLGLALMAGPARAADDFLDPEQAFGLTAKVLDQRRVELRFDIAPGYFLYREKFAVEGALAGAVLQVPRGKRKFDETFQKEVEYFREQALLIVTLPVSASAAPTAAPATHWVIVNQGCADKGLCYQPMQRVLRLDRSAAGAPQARVLAPEEATRWLAEAPTATTAPLSPSAEVTAAATAAAPSGAFDAALQSRSLWQVAGAFLLAGLLLSFTPCVLPMIPILSSIIVGQAGAHSSRAKGFSLALAYSLGMALVYTGFGVLAGLMGEGLAAALQNAWVLGAFALLLSALSLSMFGAYELQMPGAIQSRIAQWSGRLNGGQHAGVFLMGGLSALIVGPCVAAPLAGALVYISHTRDVLLGGVALFALASGMSVPLLLVGLSAGSLLPRAGAWMERIKHAFGWALLAVALWMVSPVLPAPLLMLLAAAWLLAVAVYLGAFERLPDAMPWGRLAGKGIGLTLGVLAALLLAGMASGGRELLQPLKHLAAKGGGGGGAERSTGAEGSLRFEPVTNVEALTAAIAASDRPVMLDVYADWCVACKEFEALTFTDPAVRKQLAGLKLLRVDVTANNAADKALMRQFSLFGPPAMLFFPPARADEVKAARVIGFQDAGSFLLTLQRVAPAL